MQNAKCKEKTATKRGFSLIFIFKDSVNRASENFAEVVDGYGRDRFIMLEAVDETAAEPVSVDELIGR